MASSEISMPCGCGHWSWEHDIMTGGKGECMICECLAIHGPTAAELETIVLSTRALLAEHEKAWHDALVRECGFAVGDQVAIRNSSLVGIIEMIFVNHHSDIVCVVRAAGWPYNRYLAELQRIDQVGNSLPDRTAHE